MQSMLNSQCTHVLIPHTMSCLLLKYHETWYNISDMSQVLQQNLPSTGTLQTLKTCLPCGFRVQFWVLLLNTHGTMGLQCQC